MSAPDIQIQLSLLSKNSLLIFPDRLLANAVKDNIRVVNAKIEAIFNNNSILSNLNKGIQ